MGSAAESKGNVAKIVGALVVVAVVLTGTSYWAGIKVEQAFRDAADRASEYGIKLKVLEYERNLFGATASTEATFSVNSDSPITVPFTHTIAHGPVLAPFSVASIHTEPQFPEEFAGQISEVFDSDQAVGKVPLVIDTTIGWTGGQTHHFVSPKFDAVTKDQIKVSWGGLDGVVEVNSSQLHIKTEIDIPGFSVFKDDANQIKVGHVTLTGDSSKVDGYDLFAGTSTLKLDKFTLRDASKNKGEGEHPDSSPVAFDLENFVGTGDTNIKNGAMDVTVTFGASKITLDGETKGSVEKAGVTFLYENLDLKALEAISKATQNQEDDEQQMVAVVREQSVPLLQRKPVFSIKDASALWPEGESTANFRLAYVGAGNIDHFTPNDIEVALKLRLPRTLVIRLADAQAYEDVADDSEDGEALEDSEASEENIQKLVKEQAEKQVTGLVDQGLLVSQDGALSLDASFKGGELNINGKQMPIEALLGFLPSLPMPSDAPPEAPSEVPPEAP